MNLEKHLLEGGQMPRVRSRRSDKSKPWPRDFQCAIHRTFHPPGAWVCRGDDWQAPCCWSIEMRAVVAIAEALAPPPEVPWEVARERAYLAAWPLTKQAEATADLLSGRPEAHARMLADFDAIKALYPKDCT